MSWQKSRTNERAELKGRALGEKINKVERRYVVRKERREFKRTLRTSMYTGIMHFYR